MKNKSTKKKTALKITLVLAVITGALVFLLPSRCGNENAKTQIPLPEDLRFESGSSARIEPEKTDSRAERHDEAPPVSAPFTVTAPVETPEKSVTAAIGTNEQTEGVAILPVQKESVQGENSSVIPVAAIAEAERTAVAIPVIGETTQGQSASIQREEIKAVTGKPANEAVTETADKNKMLPPEVIVKKIDAMPPEAEVSTSGAEMPETPSGKIEPEPLKVESAKNADFMPELSRESLKTTAGISTEKAALDVKSVSGAGNTSSVQRASPSSAGNEALITKGTLPPPKDTTSKNVERVLVTSPENEKQQVNHIKEAEKNEAVNPHDTHDTEATNTIRESVTNNGKENVQKTLAALTQPERKPGTLSIGILLEGNMATRQGWGAEAGFIAGYEINQDLAFGIKGGYGNDFRGIDYFEGLLYGRYYLPFKKEEFGIFAQVGIGGISFTEERKKKDAAVSTVMLDLSIGARFPFGSFYIEPYIRAGYPVFIGAGAVFGWRF